MDQTTIAGVLVLSFKLGIFGLLVMHARQARRDADAARAEMAGKPVRLNLAADVQKPEPDRVAA
ncbi:MAG: hypothetical protein AAF501_08425 [Pseudomonadota bacterium]